MWVIDGRVSHNNPNCACGQIWVKEGKFYTIMDTIFSLRNEVDKTDGLICDLIGQRMRLVRLIAQIKKSSGDSLVVPDREIAVRNNYMEKANEKDLSSEFIGELFNLILRESYLQSSHVGFRRTGPHSQSVHMFNTMGQTSDELKRQFTHSGYRVEHGLADVGEAALVIVFFSPELEWSRLISSLKLPSTCVLLGLSLFRNSELTSVLDSLLAVHQGPALSIELDRPLSSQGYAKTKIFYRIGRSERICQWILEQFRVWGAQLVQTTKNE